MWSKKGLAISTRFNRYDNEVAILDLDGTITVGEGDVELKQSVQNHLDRGFTKLILNFKAVKSMDSAGLGDLIGCQKEAEKRGARINLLNVGPKIFGVLTTAQLTGHFDIRNDEIEAIDAFRENKTPDSPKPTDPILQEDTETVN